MSRLVLSDPPKIKGLIRYRKYREWLLKNFHFRICGYCFCVHEYVVIDHISPKEAFQSLTHRFDNLIMSCQTCNRQKGDYHPAHATRKRMGNKQINHLVINCMTDDFAALYQIDGNGKIFPKSGTSFQRAAWNISLLALDRDFLEKYRAKAVRHLNILADALAEKNPPPALLAAIDDLVDSISKTQLFYRVMGVNIPPSVERAISVVDPKPLAKAV